MGCSLTEGVGCYGNDNELISIDEGYERFRERFHKYSWPAQLVKLLNYDKLINLGLGGSSTSGQLKVFMQKYEHEYFKDYEVLCLWFLSEPSRLSFYNDGHVTNIQVTVNPQSTFAKGYLESISDIKKDPLLDQLFYVKSMAQICMNKNWNFLTFHTDSYFIPEILEFDKNNYWLHDLYFKEPLYSDEYTSPIPNDTHPNEKGYKLIAKRIYKNLKNKNPNLINNQYKNPNEIEMIYDGNSEHYYSSNNPQGVNDGNSEQNSSSNNPQGVKLI